LENILIILPVILSFVILVIPSRGRYYFTLLVSLGIVLITSVPAVSVIFSKGVVPEVIHLVTGLGSITRSAPFSSL
jgi:hypothetical protein